MSKINTTQPCTTLGKIANQYCMHVETLKALIFCHADLAKEIEPYCIGFEQIGRRLLPPKVVTMIYEKLGSPN